MLHVGKERQHGLAHVLVESVLMPQKWILLKQVFAMMANVSILQNMRYITPGRRIPIAINF